MTGASRKCRSLYPVASRGTCSFPPTSLVATVSHLLRCSHMSSYIALLWGFHNATTGRCFPSYESIAERAGCARSTVYEAIHALERAGLLTWVNRLVRVREWGPDLFGRAQNRWRVIRTSNAYAFNDPQARLATKPSEASKSEFQTGTTNQEIKPSLTSASNAPKPKPDPADPLHNALLRWQAAIGSAMK